MFRTVLAVAPIVRFYTEWYPTTSQPAPAALSRHVSVHQPTIEHYSAENSLLAAMLLVSLLREICAWQRDPGT